MPKSPYQNTHYKHATFENTLKLKCLQSVSFSRYLSQFQTIYNKTGFTPGSTKFPEICATDRNWMPFFTKCRYHQINSFCNVFCVCCFHHFTLIQSYTIWMLSFEGGLKQWWESFVCWYYWCSAHVFSNQLIDTIADLPLLDSTKFSAKTSYDNYYSISHNTVCLIFWNQGQVLKGFTYIDFFEAIVSGIVFQLNYQIQISIILTLHWTVIGTGIITITNMVYYHPVCFRII